MEEERSDETGKGMSASERTPVRGGGHDCSVFPAEAGRPPRVSCPEQVAQNLRSLYKLSLPKGTDKAGLGHEDHGGQQVGTVVL